MDLSLAALQRSRNPYLHATVSAAVPTLDMLCAALDEHAVDVPAGLGHWAVGHETVSQEDLENSYGTPTAAVRT